MLAGDRRAALEVGEGRRRSARGRGGRGRASTAPAGASASCSGGEPGERGGRGLERVQPPESRRRAAALDAPRRARARRSRRRGRRSRARPPARRSPGRTTSSRSHGRQRHDAERQPQPDAIGGRLRRLLGEHDVQARAAPRRRARATTRRSPSATVSGRRAVGGRGPQRLEQRRPRGRRVARRGLRVGEQPSAGARAGRPCRAGRAAAAGPRNGSVRPPRVPDRQRRRGGGQDLDRGLVARLGGVLDVMRALAPVRRRRAPARRPPGRAHRAAIRPGIAS